MPLRDLRAPAGFLDSPDLMCVSRASHLYLPTFCTVWTDLLNRETFAVRSLETLRWFSCYFDLQLAESWLPSSLFWRIFLNRKALRDCSGPLLRSHWPLWD